MKKLLTKLTAALLICFTALMIVPVSVLQVQAAAPTVDKRINAMYYPKSPANSTYWFGINISNRTKKGKITNVKVENKDVVEVWVYDGKKSISYRTKRAGRSKVSFKYAGKTLSTTIYVEEYKNPCKKFMVGKKNYKGYFDKSGYYIQETHSKKEVTKEINVQAASGWKIVGLYCQKDGQFNMRKIKNNSKIKLKSTGIGTDIGVIFQNTKTKKKEMLRYKYGYDWTGGNEYRSRDDIQLDMDIMVQSANSPSDALN